MATLELQTRYEVYASTPINLPEGKTAADIKDVYVKYGEITITFKDSTIMMVGEADLNFDGMDYKYPGQTRLYLYGAEGAPNLVWED